MNSTLTLNGDGTFRIKHVDNLSYTYFPLCNTKSLKSSITPSLSGDANIDQNSFLLLPNSVEDLENSLLKRNVYFRINDEFTWNITGQSAKQTLSPDKVDLYGDFLVHTIVRENELFNATIESFVPSNETYQELHKITIKNTTDAPLKLKSVIGVPIYGRSADNIRDHRHVTSLLNRIKMTDHGIINHPTFSFDERGHILNKNHYGIFAKTSHHKTVKNYYPTLEEFRGEGGSLLDPLVVKEDVSSSYKPGDKVEGYEAVAGMEYESVTLKKDESFTLVMSFIIHDDEATMLKIVNDLSESHFDALKQTTKDYWQKELSPLLFHFPNQTMNGWLKWVTLQPMLRRIYGNSFMPHHDYGRGGKGWRDLWQDLLALILMHPSSVRDMLINNFNGVRIDGSNATIIGDKPGEFLADRNNIARIWMDHGSWPLLTTKLYLDRSGDVDLLFEKVRYFQDQFTHYTKRVQKNFKVSDNVLKTPHNETYYGSVLEHLIVQNLVPYYNVGEHNNLRLEDADWNDGLDMANQRGESVAFTSFYGQNLIILAKLLRQLHTKDIDEIALFEEIELLLKPIDTDDVKGKQSRLQSYFDGVAGKVSGKQTNYNVETLADILQQKGQALLQQVRKNEWLESGEDGWFNGYYDDDACALDDVEKKHMTLTGQVFSIMCDAATQPQIDKIVRSADKYLYEPSLGGYRLNTDFKEVKTNMGRLFGFAYGHKENGAMFSHMALMYAYGLYKRGFVSAGYKVIKTIFEQSMDLKTAKMYPGIPEYFNSRGRGMYSYLTGSASWMILTMVSEVFGIKGDLGLPVFEPKLLLEQFGKTDALKISTMIGKEQVEVTYHNPQRLTFGEYAIESVTIDGHAVEFTNTEYGAKLKQGITGKNIVIALNKKKETKERGLS